MQSFKIAMGGKGANLKADESTRLLNLASIDGTHGSVRLDVNSSVNQSTDNSTNSALADPNFSWKLGIGLAILSGVLFTASNFLIQYFKVVSLEVLLVRSVIQSVVLGLSLSTSKCVKIRKDRRHTDCTQTANNDNQDEGIPWYVKLFVVLQAVLGAIRLYLNFECLTYLPLGDALTLIFAGPLFTMLFSCMTINFRFGLVKLLLCCGLLTGMVLCVQPPLFFSKIDPIIGWDNMTVFNGTGFSNPTSLHYTKAYYTGVGLALGCAICGSMCNILIKKSVGVSSSSLVFFAGIAGILVSIIGCLFDENGNRIVSNFEVMSVGDWTLLMGIAVVGISAYFLMTVSLKLVSPTSVSVLRAMEILLAYLCQIVVMGQMPNVTCVGGAVLVMISVVGIAVEEKIYSDQ